MIQAALFASFLSTFLIQTLSLLQPDPLGAIQDILLYQTLVMQNSTSGPYVTPVFSPPPYAIAVNALFFASLGIVLVAAFLCMLVKGWIRELDRKLLGIPDLEKRAVIKELREQGLARWRLPEIIIFLPSLIHISLVLFFVGLALYLLQVHPLLAFLSIAIFGLGVLVYFLSIVISAVDDFAPFRSMYSRALGVLYRHLYPRPIPNPVSRSALPQTTIEKIHERISTSIIKYEPLSEQAILEPTSPSLKQIISNTSVTIFNKIWSPVSKRETSADAKNISTSILLQLDVTHIRPSHHELFPLPCKTSNPPIKEAEGLAYSVCMMGPTSASRLFVRSTRAAIDVLQQSSDPWPRLVASLTSAWTGCAERELSKWPDSRGTWMQNLSIAGHKEYILRAISDVGIFSAEEWCFVLSSIYALFVLNAQYLGLEIRALTELLTRLLQAGVYHIQGSNILPNVHTDFWLYVMMSVLDKETPVQHGTPISKLKSSGEILHARDISVYGDGVTRDPKWIRRLLQLSREQKLNQSSMRKCLISILYILISFEPSTEQQIQLVDQYMEIIEEEMDMIDWSLYLSGLLNNEHISVTFMSRTVLCLLSGRYHHLPHRYDYFETAPSIMREYDLKLSAASTQPTPSILKVLDKVIPRWSVTGLELQNSWLSLYTCNLTHSPYHFGIPFTWSPGCISIASSRLDLYDSGDVAPEIDLITSFLSCPSISTACRALHWYLSLKESALASGDTKHVTTVFPIIFRKYLSVDDNCMSWLLLVDVLLPSLSSMSLQGKGHFVETFFGYGSPGGNSRAEEDRSTLLSSRAGDENVSSPVHLLTPMATLQPDGLGWMEDIWTTVLRGLVVHPDHIKAYWPGLLGVMHATYPEPGRITELMSPIPSSPSEVPATAPERTPSAGRAPLGPEILEKRLAESARCVLEVLAQLLEAGTGLIPAVLLNRVRNSPLLSDRRLDHDTSSLDRIRVILDQRV